MEKFGGKKKRKLAGTLILTNRVKSFRESNLAVPFVSSVCTNSKKTAYSDQIQTNLLQAENVSFVNT